MRIECSWRVLAVFAVGCPAVRRFLEEQQHTLRHSRLPPENRWPDVTLALAAMSEWREMPARNSGESPCSFAAAESLISCELPSCGKLQQTKNEFKLCSRCRQVRYCSAACQQAHWKAGHKAQCSASSAGDS